MKANEDDTNRWKDILCSWIGRIDTGKITILSKAIYTFNATHIKISLAFLTELEKFQNLYKIQMIPNSQNNLEKEEQG